MKKIRWGILGVNWIADRIGLAISHFPEAELVAAASRTKEKTEDFAQRHGIPRVYSSAEELATAGDIDIIYVSTPHRFHFEHSMICLKNNVHVLCEKPFTVTRAQAQELFDTANSRGLLIMEAMWTCFLPALIKMRELIAKHEIGDIKWIECECGFAADLDNHQGRLLNPQLAGGALLDLGVYPLSIIQMLIGKPPVEIKSMAAIGPTGVDLRNASSMKYADGEMASFTSAIDATFDVERVNVVYGTEGCIRFNGCFAPQSFTIKKHGAEERVYELPFEVNGHEYQIAAAHEAIKNGSRVRQEETLEVMGIMDAIRAGWLSN